MPVRPARRERRLPDRMTRLMLLLAHWTDYPPAGGRLGDRFSREENGVVSEYPLRGGSVSTVIRAGDTVRRQPGRRFVREVRAAFEWVAAHRSELQVS